jgi:hypothetical protein
MVCACLNTPACCRTCVVIGNQAWWHHRTEWGVGQLSIGVYRPASGCYRPASGKGFIPVYHPDMKLSFCSVCCRRSDAAAAQAGILPAAGTSGGSSSGSQQPAGSRNVKAAAAGAATGAGAKKTPKVGPLWSACHSVVAGVNGCCSQF